MFNLVNSIAMPSFVDRIANSLSDLAILALSAIAFGLVGGLVALLSNRFWFRRWPQHSAYEDKLGDAAHTSMLGFSAFVLALLITNGLTSLSKAEDATRSEATAIYRLGRELDALGPVAQGDAEAQYFLGGLYLSGHGVTRDSAEAISWYRRAGYQGFALAGLSLGSMYANGQGAEQNYVEAARWFRLAADKGIPVAMYRLGLMYANGQGVLQNYILAHMWLNLSSDQYAMDARDKLTAMMTPAQIAEAQRLAQEWKPTK
jgi:hypothetical protein